MEQKLLKKEIEYVLKHDGKQPIRRKQSTHYAKNAVLDSMAGGILVTDNDEITLSSPLYKKHNHSHLN